MPIIESLIVSIAALQRINTFVSGALSSLYFEETKDILYCDEATSPRRQAVTAVLGHVSLRCLDCLLAMLDALHGL
jgi:isoleucyl-tRNA synthetase